jgi:hypothetical protein
MRRLPSPRGPVSERLIAAWQGEPVLLGARALSHLDGLWSSHVLRRWNEGRTWLLRQLEAPRTEPVANPVLASG